MRDCTCEGSGTKMEPCGEDVPHVLHEKHVPHARNPPTVLDSFFQELSGGPECQAVQVQA
jgi:hypothetical protein